MQNFLFKTTLLRCDLYTRKCTHLKPRVQWILTSVHTCVTAVVTCWAFLYPLKFSPVPFALINPPSKIFWCLIQCSLHCPILRFDSLFSSILLQRIQAGSQPASSRWVMRVNGKPVGWLLQCWFLLPRLQKGRVGSPLRRAWRTGHPLTCLYWLPCSLQRGAGGDGVLEETTSRGCLTPGSSAQSPPWKPALCCLVAVP